MKVAIAIEGGSDLRASVCPTFGRAPWFLLVDEDTGLTTLLDNQAATGAHGAGTGTAGLMVQHGVDAVISGRFGPNAFQALGTAGIRMFASLTDASAGAALERLRAGALKPVESA